jgi:transposase
VECHERVTLEPFVVQGRPLSFVLTGGEVSDYKAVPTLFNLPITPPKMMLADKGYDGDDVRSSLLMHGILPVIQANRKEPIASDFKAYKDRNRIERMFNRLKQFRRIATRYDKTAVTFIGFLCLAAAKLWLPSFQQA